MGIFNRENKEVAELKKAVKTLAAEVVEQKGYFAASETNELFKQLEQVSFKSAKMIEWDNYNRSNLFRIYKETAQVRGMVDLIANAVAELAPFIEVLDENDKESKKFKWLTDLLNNPNDLQTRRQFIQAWAINRLVSGDAFVYAEKAVGINRGQVGSMYVMHSQDTEIVKDGVRITGYKVSNWGDLERPLKPEEVAFFRTYNPDPNNMYGFSPLYSAARYTQLLENGIKRQNTSFINGGAATIITPKPDQYGGATEQDKDSLEGSLNGEKAFGKHKVVRIPVETHTLGSSPADLSILETSKEAVKALCFVYNVPFDLYNGEAKYTNTKEAKKALYELSAIPLMNEFCEGMTKFLKLNGVRMVLNTDKIEILRDSPTEMMNTLTQMYASVNQKYEYMGYPRIEEAWADQPIIPMGVMVGNPDIVDINENENQ